MKLQSIVMKTLNMVVSTGDPALYLLPDPQVASPSCKCVSFEEKEMDKGMMNL